MTPPRLERREGEAWGRWPIPYPIEAVDLFGYAPYNFAVVQELYRSTELSKT